MSTIAFIKHQATHIYLYSSALTKSRLQNCQYALIDRNRSIKLCTHIKHSRQINTKCALGELRPSEQRPRLTRQFPVIFDSDAQIQTAVEETTGVGLGLNDYMLLPVSQYVNLELPLGAFMEKMDSLQEEEGDDDDKQFRFKMTIPELKFFSIVVRVLLCLVVESVPASDPRQLGPCVLVHSSGARVEGPLADKLGLNDLFEFQGVTFITWHVGQGSDDESFIRTDTEIVVGVDPPGPFESFPKRLLTGVGNTVIRATNTIIQKVFVEKLAEDYKMWSTDVHYRMGRDN